LFASRVSDTEHGRTDSGSSITRCEPAGNCHPVALSLFALVAVGPVVLSLELFNPASTVNQLHVARVKRVARGADIDVQLVERAASRERVPATADDIDLFVLRMNALFHDFKPVASNE